jgi:hypothetical protein
MRPCTSLSKAEAEPSEGDSPVNYMLIMNSERSGLMAIGPLSIEYQAAMLRDEIEESSNWTTLGIARILNEEQARSAIRDDGAIGAL